MSKLYDSEGNEVEAFTKEETDTLIESKVGETKKEFEERIAGLEDKDRNFKALRAKVEKGEQLTVKEKELYDRENELKTKEKSFQERLTDSWRERALRSAVGDDAELREKVLFIYDNEIKTEAQTEEDIALKVEKAVALANFEKARPNPLNQAMGISGRSPDMGKKEEKFTDTIEGKEIFNKIAPELKEEK